MVHPAYLHSFTVSDSLAPVRAYTQPQQVYLNLHQLPLKAGMNRQAIHYLFLLLPEGGPVHLIETSGISGRMGHIGLMVLRLLQQGLDVIHYACWLPHTFILVADPSLLIDQESLVAMVDYYLF